MQKTQSDIQQVLSATSANGFPPSSVRDLDMGTAVIHEDGTVVRPSIDDKLSTRGIISTSPTIQPADANGIDNEPDLAVPTIRISSDSSRENRENDKKEEENGKTEPGSHDKDDAEENESESKDTVDRKIEKGKAKEVERPVKAAGDGEQNVNEASPAPAQEPFSFSNKRLCERWLDNLFMVLYEVGYPSFQVYLRPFNDRLT